MPTVRRMRRRTGATAWRLCVDAAEPERYLELYTVTS